MTVSGVETPGFLLVTKLQLCECDCTLFPTFMMEGDAHFQLQDSENEDGLFLSHVVVDPRSFTHKGQ